MSLWFAWLEYPVVLLIKCWNSVSSRTFSPASPPAYVKVSSYICHLNLIGHTWQKCSYDIYEMRKCIVSVVCRNVTVCIIKDCLGCASKLRRSLNWTLFVSIFVLLLWLIRPGIVPGIVLENILNNGPISHKALHGVFFSFSLLLYFLLLIVVVLKSLALKL